MRRIFKDGKLIAEVPCLPSNAHALIERTKRRQEEVLKLKYAKIDFDKTITI